MQNFKAKNNYSNSLLTTKEAAEVLGVRPQTLSVWISTKRYAIKSYKVGRLRKFKREDLNEFLESNSSQE